MTQLRTGLLARTRGNPEALARLERAVEMDHLASTLLFVGPSGVGRRQIAMGLLQKRVCDQAPKGCGVCGPCLRVAHNQSESLLIVEPEKNLISVESAKRILDFVSLRGLGKARAVILDSAHLMHVSAANSLLKLLEEPPENTFFFLIAPSPRHVLPTIRSRSQVIRFLGLSEVELKSVVTPLFAKEIESVDADLLQWALRESRGSVERFGVLISETQLGAQRLAKRFLGECLEDSEFFFAEDWRDFVRSREQALQLSRHLVLLVKDRMRGHPLASAGASAGDGSVRGLLSLSDLVLRLDGYLQGYRDPILVFEEFWLKQNSERMRHVG